MANKKTRKNGEGTLFKRSDGRWQASFVPENGKRLYFYGKTKAEALEKLRKAQQEDQKGLLATGPKQKLGDYLVEWLEATHKPPMVKPSTYIQYRSVIHRHLVPGLGHVSLRKLTPQHIQAFYAQKIKEGLKPRTIALIHAALHKALENAVKWNLISRNVASLVSLPRAEAHEIHPLTSDEIENLVAAAKGHWLEPILILAVTTGMRRGELLALHWNDVDLERGVLHVRHTVNRLGSYGVVEHDPKTRSSRRKVVLPNVALSMLKDHRLHQDQIKVKAGDNWKAMNLVFTNDFGDFISVDKLLRHFKALLEKAGLPHMRFHDLRHSAATILLTMGVHPKVVQELLGHSTIAMTMDTYSHLLPSMQKDAANKMDSAFQFGDETGEKDEAH
ncbi:MAG TPA: tyrosine-type recombinase/integrase [Ktedonobacteraceae bacterium]